MGTWGTNITHNDGTMDVLVDWGNRYFKKHTDSDGYVDFKKAKITKTEFGKVLSKLLKAAEMTTKELKKPYLLGSPFVASLQYTNKYSGYWNINLVLAIYILGRNCGYVFHKDFMDLVKVCAYQYMATCGLFRNESHRKSLITLGNAIAKSTTKKGKLNLMRYF
jgi:hypothetical protein